MRRKGVLMTLLFLWVFLVGMAILLYPAINSYYTGKRMESSVESFYGTAQTETPPENTEPPAVETKPTTPFPELLEMLNEYNQELFENDQAGLSSLAATEQPGAIFSVSGQKGNVFGVLSIPKLNMEMPLYLGATNQHMADGAAQLGQTSIPVGGENTNAVIAMDKNEAKPPKVTPCINCGACLNHCPLKLDPREIARAYKRNSAEDLQMLCVDLCMECGCCSYVCPAKRPLVQTNKLAKAKLREYVNSKKAEGEGKK